MASNAEALEETLKALNLAGRLEQIDSAAVEMLRSLAAAIDANPDKAALYREYRETLSEVRAAGDESDDDLSEALAQIRGAAPMGDQA